MKPRVFPALTLGLVFCGAISVAQVSPNPAAGNSSGQDSAIPASATPTPATPAPAASTAPASSTQQPASSIIAAGSIIPAELSKSLDARKLKAGDRVETKTTVDLLSHGKIILPRNTKIIGHVTEAKARSKQSADSSLGVTFDHLLTKDGHELPIQVTIQAIGRPLLNVLPGYEPVGESPASMASTAPPGTGGSLGGPLAGGGSRSSPSSYPSSNAPSSQYPPGTGGPPGADSVSALTPYSQGMVGLKGLSLTANGQTAVVSSSTQNVHLDGSSQLIFKTQ